jgi:DNA-binding Xre family transcriptional regulator
MTRLRIRELATQRGLNQKELADKSGVSAQLINRYWNYPMQRVELDALAKIAKALHCKVADLIEVEGEDEQSEEQAA